MNYIQWITIIDWMKLYFMKDVGSRMHVCFTEKRVWIRLELRVPECESIGREITTARRRPNEMGKQWI